MTKAWILGLLAVALATGASAEPPPQMRLLDDLDFPGEGYCIDVVGVGMSARTDMPLVAHNCLPARGSVDRVVVMREGRLRFPAYDACVTAFGVVAPLPGSAVVLQPCGGGDAFVPAAQLQLFERTPTGQLRLENSTLCLTVGADAARTLSATHRWRTLTMERCDTASPALSVWR
ncbi:MAG: hypothetical protein AAFS07_09820 [Pseudomonadota bacterium]